MEEPLSLFSPGPEIAPGAEAAPAASLHRATLRRLWTLAAAGGMAFALTTWMMVRIEFPRLAPDATPSGIVRAQLDALNRGELRHAYNLFSGRYREHVTFEAYHQLVITHWRMFHTRELRFSRDDECGGRAQLEAQLLGQDGAQYVARFTLVRADGGWWVDDLRWRAAADEKHLLRT